MKKNPENYRHGDLAHAILQDALEILKVRTHEELSLRELAERAGVSPRAPYSHFSSKNELLVAIIEHGFEELAQYFRKTDRTIVSLGKEYLRFSEANPNLVRLMFSALACDGQQQPLVGAENAYTILLDAVRLRMPAIPEDEVVLATIGLWSLVHGLAVLRQEKMIDDTVWQTLDLQFLGQLLGRLHSA